jgi:hypothetical protein
MKGDFTRFTHDPSKHYSGVLEQQGRVALEADRNEAFEIQAYLEQTAKRNIIGLSGVPINNSGFTIGITPDTSDLTIAPGRIYVDGILVELEESDDEITYTKQPDYPDPPALLPPVAGRTDLVYLDVWQRHVTAVEDPDIREVALPVPDTTTRLQTLGQVKVLPDVGNSGCDAPIPGWDSLIKPSGGRLTTEVDVQPAAENPCDTTLNGGYRGLENRLYRVEIHTGSDTGTPTFKWSRDNGSVVFAIEEISQNEDNKVKLKRLGRDQVLTLHVGDWVEVLGDETETNGQHGTLARIVENGIDEVERGLTLSKDVSIHAGEGHPKVRRWDQQSDAVTVTTNPGSDPITLEEGIAVRFSGDDFRAGDYWTFAARAATGTTGTLEILTSAPPQGTQHHYCRLALVTWSRKGPGKLVGIVRDCRKLFPPLTELRSLYYVGGDGQEAMPGEFLPKSLQVRVANGRWPVQGAQIRFVTASGTANGTLHANGESGGTVTIQTGSSGLAECTWQLDMATHSQQVEAHLLDDSGNLIQPPVRFTANLSVAGQVAYTPPNDCPPLAGTATVEQALNALCKPDSGGGCSVTVGQDGQYKSLTEALDALKGQDDICITLLPGDHKPPAAGTIDNHRHVELIGCTPGSRIVLDRPLHFELLASCTLRDLEIKVGLDQPVAQPLVFDRCDEVKLESCYLSGFIPREEDLLLRITGAGRIRLEYNQIEALLPELEQGSLRSPLVVFQGVDREMASGVAREIAKLFDEASYQGRFDRSIFEQRALRVAEDLCNRDPGERSDLARKIRDQASSPRLVVDIEERESYERFAQALELDTQLKVTLLQDRLLRCLIRIRDAASPVSPCTAVVIEAAHSTDKGAQTILADTSLESNDIVGAVSFYGVPGETELAGNVLDTKALTELGKKIRRAESPKITISEAFGTLHVLNNKLTRLVVAKDMIIELRRKAFSQSSEQIVGVYGRSFITNNVFAGESNVLLAYHHSLNSNAFNSGARENTNAAHKVIGDSVILLGNYAPATGIELINISRVNQKSANLTLAITDL